MDLKKLEAASIERDETDPGAGAIMWVARDEIERLRARVERLREILRRIDEASNHYAMTPTYSEGTLRYAHRSTRDLARAALQENTDDE